MSVQTQLGLKIFVHVGGNDRGLNIQVFSYYYSSYVFKGLFHRFDRQQDGRTRQGSLWLLCCLLKENTCNVQGKCSVKGGGGGHIRAAFTTAEWCIPLYTRAGQPSGLTDLKTTVYSTARL